MKLNQSKLAAAALIGLFSVGTAGAATGTARPVNGKDGCSGKDGCKGKDKKEESITGNFAGNDFLAGKDGCSGKDGCEGKDKKKDGEIL